MFQFEGLNFDWTGHDGFRIEIGGKVVYIDPFRLGPRHKNRNDADLALISHNHFDHLSIDDLRQVASAKTVYVAAKECAEKLKEIAAPDKIRGVLPGDSVEFVGIKVEAVPAYNTNKTFHPRQDRKVGFVISAGGLRIYHTGDTDEIPEMSSVNPDVALVPVSGTYVMNAEEAARAVNEKIKPKKLAIPMHYGAIVGSRADAAKFKDLVKSCAVQILDQG